MWATVLFLAALGVAVGAGSLRQSALDRRAHGRRVTRMARLTVGELSRLTSLPGRAAVRGCTVAGPRGLVRAPLSNMECLWYRTTTERTTSSGWVALHVETDGSAEIALGDRVYLAADLAAHPLVPGAPTLVQTTVSEYSPAADGTHITERIVPAGLAVLAIGRPCRRDIGIVLEPADGSGTTALTDREVIGHVDRVADRQARVVTPLALVGLTLFLLGLWSAAAGR